MTVADVGVFPDLSLYFWAQPTEPTGPIMNRVFNAILALGLAVVSPAVAVAQPADPLPSWNDGEVKHAIIQFVTSVITEGNYSTINWLGMGFFTVAMTLILPSVLQQTRLARSVPQTV